jgi:hypothetical protein
MENLEKLATLSRQDTGLRKTHQNNRTQNTKKISSTEPTKITEGELRCP